MINICVCVCLSVCLCVCRGAEPSQAQLVSLVLTGVSNIVVLWEAGEKQSRSLLRANEQEQCSFDRVPLGQPRELINLFMMVESKIKLTLQSMMAVLGSFYFFKKVFKVK